MGTQGDLAFSVVNDDLGCSDYTLAHEIGHNLGCLHDRPNADAYIDSKGKILHTGFIPVGAFPYSYGYGKEGNFGTIMSYIWPRIGKFSNPDIRCMGEPCGISELEPNSANNAKTMNLTALAVSGFRQTSAISPEYTYTPGSLSEYTDNGDGTVTHKTNGLTWMRCVVGQSWTGTDCTGEAGRATWDQAMALTATYAGKSDWRLPTISELNSIVKFSASYPAIDASIFPNTPTSYFWSASAYVGNSGSAWVVYFGSAVDNYFSKWNTFRVRLVRGGQLLDSYGLYTPTTDFTDNGDGTVTHKKTSLIWKRCSEGQTWDSSGCSGTASTHTWAQATATTSSYAGKNDWRLPTQNELLTIVERSAYGPAINATIFPGTPGAYFWSASAYAEGSDGAWAVYFDSGSDYPDHKSLSYYVRLVRGGQSLGPFFPTVDLDTLSLSCPATLAQGASATCSATATYSDKTSKPVTPIWSVTGSGASIATNGLLSPGQAVEGKEIQVTANYTENGITRSASTTVKVIAPMECLFTWAEKNYPELFAPPGASTQSGLLYFFRYYGVTKALLSTDVEPPSLLQRPVDQRCDG